jgi:DNA (cytosine-5)-methyltransferase 1
MENVKGMLSSSLHESRIFGLVLKDLRMAGGGYQLVTLAPRHTSQADLIAGNIDPRDFIIRAEEFGLPQARHRVIVVGIRQDLIHESQPLQVGQWMTSSNIKASVEDVLKGLPKLRSGLSHEDSPALWRQTMRDAAAIVSKAVAVWPANERKLFRERINECTDIPADLSKIWHRTAPRPAKVGPKCARTLSDWLLDPQLGVLPNNETRCHMPSDFARYMFAAVYAEMSGVSPKAGDFPEMLYPDHRSWDSGNFADRFRVQLWDHPSTTITSHISKDGHYFIHPDPEQCRSLTVREAARLQTFPDNYFFKGTRTQQFVQVGNAVPPFLAKQIGDAIHSLLQKILTTREPARGKETLNGTDKYLRHKSVAPSSMMRNELDRLSSAVGGG